VPWTLNDEDVWRQSHRVGGRIMVVSGLLMVAVSLVAPLMASMWLITIIVIGMVAGLIGYSYWVAMQKRHVANR
jgi:uncharacterized membrane protein